ncbi:hypothetical protein [Colwellia sp. MEBiC06753]
MKKFPKNAPIIGLLISLLLTGCSQFSGAFSQHSTGEKPVDLGAYYQWIKALEPKQLSAEIALQKQRVTNNQTNAQIYLLMLHSLPSAPIHNPYIAKSMLNDGAFNQYLFAHVSSEDLALITLLRDQLNQQLLLIQAQEKQSSQNKQTIAQLKLTNTMKQNAINSLNDKIKQLKAIEAQLSTRENQ